MKRYKITLEGLSPLLMHNDNFSAAEKIMKWRKDPENKEFSVPGDDRTPPWTWIGYTYHDGKVLGINSDNLMTMLREGGAKVPKKGKETYKKQTQSGVMIDQEQFTLLMNGEPVLYKDGIADLIGHMDFADHVEYAEEHGFELFAKRSIVGRARHIRVRPMFRNWVAEGSVTVIDEDLSGVTEDVLQLVLNQAGALCGLCDWRPSSGASGAFGKFRPHIELML